MLFNLLLFADQMLTGEVKEGGLILVHSNSENMSICSS